MSALTIRALREADEASALTAHAELAAEGFEFLQDIRMGECWSAYVQRVARWPSGDGLPDGWVPATFGVGVINERVIGRVLLRHRLTPFLAEIGGHIGYAVRPTDRRRGFASALLRNALLEAHDLGLDRVLLTCDEDNEASASVIEKCGGHFERLSELVDGSPVKRRYWIEL
jgi:predicted acetyltransferase